MKNFIIFLPIILIFTSCTVTIGRNSHINLRSKNSEYKLRTDGYYYSIVENDNCYEIVPIVFFPNFYTRMYPSISSEERCNDIKEKQLDELHKHFQSKFTDMTKYTRPTSWGSYNIDEKKITILTFYPTGGAIFLGLDRFKKTNGIYLSDTLLSFNNKEFTFMKFETNPDSKWIPLNKKFFKNKWIPAIHIGPF